MTRTAGNGSRVFGFFLLPEPLLIIPQPSLIIPSTGGCPEDRAGADYCRNRLPNRMLKLLMRRRNRIGGIRDEAVGRFGVIRGTTRASRRQAGDVEAPHPSGQNGLLALPDADTGIIVLCGIQVFAHVGCAAGL
jgi:hypothetical protein